MHGEAYLMSSRIAEVVGPFAGFSENRDAFLEVIGMHRKALEDVTGCDVPPSLWYANQEVWKECVASGAQHGYRNAQVTVLAPTGTIGFMMDCDTTGIEPDLALVKYKKLVGGGLIKLVTNVRARGAHKAGLQRRADQRDRQLHQGERNDRRRAGPQGGASSGFRLLAHACERPALDPLHGPRANDGRGPAVSLRGDLQDG